MRILDWTSLSTPQRIDVLRRPAQRDAAAVREAAQDIIDAVRRDGDAAVLKLTEKFDGVRLASTQVTPQEFEAAERALTAVQTAAIAKLLPGSESPTVIPLEGLGDRVAVHAVCRENVFWETLEDLKGVGATSVLVLPVEKMLA